MEKIANALRKLLGPDIVASSEEACRAHSQDKWFASHLPEVVVSPESSAQVARLMRWASRHGVAVTAQGAQVGYVGGCVPATGGVALSLKKMQRIREISKKDFVAVVEPGVITGKLQAAARRKGLFYPPDPASLEECSIGGNIATNAGGPRCLKYGVTRHYVLGLEVVLATGEVVKLGSRTHKNKTGFDLVGLMVGSEGMLGIVTEATLKLLPHPPHRGALAASFVTFAQAARAVQHIFGQGFLPSALEIADGHTLEAARGYWGAQKIPPGQAHLLVEIDGQEASVRGELRQLLRELDACKAQSIETAPTPVGAEKLWKVRRGYSEALRASGRIKLNEDVVVPRGRLVDLVRFADRLQKKYGFPLACFGHAGDGNIHVNLMVEQSEVESGKGKRALDELFTQVLEWGGVVTGEHGIGLAKEPWIRQALQPSAFSLHRAVKKALDSQGILNPNKWLL